MSRKVKQLLVGVSALFFGFMASAQEREKPKLVVGIVVDQMRYEYLDRYYETFGEGGFKRLLSEGFNCKNTHYNYIPTKTGPGHASIYTGTTPSVHGIILNEWFVRETGQELNCVDDLSVTTVGAKSSEGERSPALLLSPTITDQLKVSSQGRSKVVSISLKDRGAILPGGHMADAAYWYDQTNGNFVSSTFYMEKLPKWVANFNTRKWADKYLAGSWEASLPKEKYSASQPDDSPFEKVFHGSQKSTLPYDLTLLNDEGKYKELQDTPYGNDLVKDMAILALENEGLGTDDEPDFFAISFSSTDKVGHEFGPQSVEVQDTYVKLDRNLAEIFDELDQRVGKGNYTVFLTADHGVAENPNFLNSKNLPGGYYSSGAIKVELNSYLESQFSVPELVEHFADGMVYFDRDVIKNAKLNSDDVLMATYDFFSEMPIVSDVLMAKDLRRFDFGQGQKKMVQLGYHRFRSGEVTVLFRSGFIGQRETGSNHGSGFSYDSHVPLLWMGHGIPQGESYQPRAIVDIAPTLAYLLGIKIPDTVTGQAILSILED